MTCETELRDYFHGRDDVAFAYLFGSAVTGRQTRESDIDIAVYFVPANCVEPFDLEETDAWFDAEYEVWSAAERVCATTVDLVVLNRAPATLAAGAMLRGKALSVNKPGLHRAYFDTVVSLAEEYRAFAEEFAAIKRRSTSLSPLDRDRLVRILDFLGGELDDAHLYDQPDPRRYAEEGHYRRGLERWVENLVNASIDVAKIVLASERTGVPPTYRSQLERLGQVEEFHDVSDTLARNTRVRNALAHEYVDLRYTRTSEVAMTAAGTYRSLVHATPQWMERNASEDDRDDETGGS